MSKKKSRIIGEWPFDMKMTNKHNKECLPGALFEDIIYEKILFWKCDKCGLQIRKEIQCQ